MTTILLGTLNADGVPATVTFDRHGETITVHPTPVPAAQVDALLRRPAADLNWYERTVRNAVRAAKRNKRCYHVGRTYTQAHITEQPEPSTGMTLDVTATPNGRLYKWAKS